MSVIQTVLVIIVMGGLYYFYLYNNLVSLRQKVKESFSDVDVQLKRRWDLIPNLVNTVKGYAKHEQETLEKVIQARNSAMSVPSGDLSALGKAETGLVGALKSIFALAERYPDLKANENFLELQKALKETEDQISASRRIYNGNVSEFNTKIDTLPTKFVAQFHHIQKADFFDLGEEEREKMQEAPKVDF